MHKLGEVTPAKKDTNKLSDYPISNPHKVYSAENLRPGAVIPVLALMSPTKVCVATMR
jgi:hypothetical protein